MQTDKLVLEAMKKANRTPEEIAAVTATLEVASANEELSTRWVLNTCLNVLTGTPLTYLAPVVSDDAEWGEIYLGDGTKPGHRLRVAPNAYAAGTHAEEHNGRQGVFGGARNGYVYLKYDDEVADNQGTPHKPNLVQKLISE